MFKHKFNTKQIEILLNNAKALFIVTKTNIVMFMFA